MISNLVNLRARLVNFFLHVVLYLPIKLLLIYLITYVIEIVNLLQKYALELDPFIIVEV